MSHPWHRGRFARDHLRAVAAINQKVHGASFRLFKTDYWLRYAEEKSNFTPFFYVDLAWPKASARIYGDQCILVERMADHYDTPLADLSDDILAAAAQAFLADILGSRAIVKGFGLISDIEEIKNSIRCDWDVIADEDQVMGGLVLVAMLEDSKTILRYIQSSSGQRHFCPVTIRLETILSNFDPISDWSVGDVLLLRKGEDALVLAVGNGFTIPVQIDPGNGSLIIAAQAQPAFPSPENIRLVYGEVTVSYQTIESMMIGRPSQLPITIGPMAKVLCDRTYLAWGVMVELPNLNEAKGLRLASIRPESLSYPAAQE